MESAPPFIVSNSFGFCKRSVFKLAFVLNLSVGTPP